MSYTNYDVYKSLHAKNSFILIISYIDIMIMVDLTKEELSKYRTPLNNFCADLDLENNVLLSPKLQSRSFFDEWKQVLPFYQNVLKEGVLYA